MYGMLVLVYYRLFNIPPKYWLVVLVWDGFCVSSDVVQSSPADWNYTVL